MGDLHPQVSVHISNGFFVLHDQRTARTFQVQASEQIAAFLEQAGLTRNLSDNEARRRQRVFARGIQAQQRDSNLAALLQYATRHVPYYRDHVPYYRDRAALFDATSTQHLERLPIMTSDHIWSNLLEMISDTVDRGRGLAAGELEVAHTSGSSNGHRLMVISDMTLSRVPPNYREIWQLKLPELIITAVLTSPLCTSRVCGHVDARSRDGGLVEFLSTAENPFDLDVEKICRELDDTRPDLLMVNPVYACVLSRRARQLDLPLPPVQAVLLSYQYAGQRQRRVLSEAFRAPVYDLYSATELAGAQIGFQCRHGNMHVREDHSLLEIQAPAGDVGELLVTTIGSRVMPLVRYQVGDLGRFTDAECDCEASEWQTFELHGRSHDALILGGKRITTRQVDDALADVRGCDIYQMQGKNDSVTVLVVPDDEDELDEAALRDGLRPCGARRVDIRRVPRFPTSRSMKYPLTLG